MSRRTAPSPTASAGAVTVSVRLNAASHRRLRVAAARKGVSMGVFLADLWERSREAKAEAQAERVDNRGH
jgi:ribosomal protein L15E